MMRLTTSALLVVAATYGVSQTPAPTPAKTASPKPRTAVHHATSTKTASAKTTSTKTATGSAGSAEANGPGIPKATGVLQTLYALKYVDLVLGTGDLAVPRKFYTVNYTGWLTNGTKFDSSVDRNQPFTFPYGAKRVITGWDTGFEGMRVGGKRRLIVPYELAYGEMGSGPIPAKSTLIFDVELLGMADAPPAPPAAPKPATDSGDTTPKPSEAPPASSGAPGAAAPGKPGAPGSAAPPAPASAPGNPGHPDPAKLPGGPPTGV